MLRVGEGEPIVFQVSALVGQGSSMRKYGVQAALSMTDPEIAQLFGNQLIKALVRRLERDNYLKPLDGLKAEELNNADAS